MEMAARVTIRGAKYFTGNMEGKEYDTGTIFVDVELRGESSKGVCTQALKCENSKVVKSILHNPMPFIAEVLMLETTNGKDRGDLKVVTEIRPLQREARPEAQDKPGKAEKVSP